MLKKDVGYLVLAFILNPEFLTFNSSQMLPLSKKTSLYITTKLMKINPLKIKKNVTKYKFLINREKKPCTIQ